MLHSMHYFNLQQLGLVYRLNGLLSFNLLYYQYQGCRSTSAHLLCLKWTVHFIGRIRTLSIAFLKDCTAPDLEQYPWL